MRVIGSNANKVKSSLQWIKSPESIAGDQVQAYYTLSGNCVVKRAVGNIPTSDIPLERSGSSNITHLEVSSDGTIVAIARGSPEPDILVRSLNTGDVKFRFEDHDHGVSGIAISHDNKYMMSVGGTHDRRVFVFDLTTGDIVSNTVLGTNQAIHAVVSGGFVLDIKNRPTSKYMFVTCGLNHINVWEFDPIIRQLDWRSVVGRHVREFTSVSLIQGLLFAGTTTGDIITVIMKSLTVSPNSIPVSGSGGICTMTTNSNDLVVVGSMDGSITFFRLENSQLVFQQKLFLEKNSPITSIAIKGTFILVATQTGSEFLVTSLSPSKTSPSLKIDLIRQVPYFPISEILFHEKSHRLVVASCDIHNSFDYGVSWARFYSNSYAASSCSINSNLIVVGYEEKLVGLDSKTGSYLWTIPFEPDPSRIDLSSKHHLLVGSKVGDICLYDLRSKQMKSRSKDCSSQITGAKFFSSDQYCIASGGRSLVTYDLTTQKRITHHRERNLGINGFSLFLDQASVVSIGAEKIVSFWDLRVREPINTVPSLIELTAVSLSPSQTNIAFGSITGSVCLWDSRRGDWRITPSATPQGQRINSIQWINETQIVSGGLDNCVTIHDPFEEEKGRVSEPTKEPPPVLSKLDLSCIVNCEN